MNLLRNRLSCKSGPAFWQADPVDSSLYLPTSRTQYPQSITKPFKAPHAQPLVPRAHHQSCPLNKNPLISSLPKASAVLFQREFPVSTIATQSVGQFPVAG